MEFVRNSDLDLPSDSREKFVQGFNIGTVGLAWTLFVFSAFKYEGVDWFYWLLFTRVFAVLLGAACLVLWIFRREKGYQHIDTIFLITSLYIQGSHGALEASDSKEFYSYTGIIFLMVALSFRGSFNAWLTRILPISLVPILVPLFFKSRSMVNSLGGFVDNFSLVIAGVAVGSVVARINATKHLALRNYVRSQNELLEERRKALEYQEQVGRRIQLELEKARKRIEEESRFYAMGKLAAQLAHDIRSPLAALDSVANTSEPRNGEQGKILRHVAGRIRDIANQLIQTGSVVSGVGSQDCIRENEGVLIEHVANLIETLLSEKRLQYSSRAEIRIEHEEMAGTYGLFCQVRAAEFKRVLSNLIDNAVEAIRGSGQVLIQLFQQERKILIKVIDSGVGIPDELLPRLAEPGVTFGKLNGSGLGLHHARRAVGAWGGVLKIESQLGTGTTVSIILPKAEPPNWFLQELEVPSEGHIIVTDDDSCIHAFWRKRFSAKECGLLNAEIVDCSRPDVLKKWVMENALLVERTRFLVDFEFSGCAETGISLIEDLGIAQQSVLVTSRFDEAAVLEDCGRLGIRILPKPFVSAVPIMIVPADVYSSGTLESMVRGTRQSVGPV
ncbi:MAG TPA: HAMP domain-containing sensor histidine kinase [Bdellovibrionota bacterium]|nr:HAMP domain-containing sensor histidine kinase [Bdellovibrionota bacterium]